MKRGLLAFAIACLLAAVGWLARGTREQARCGAGFVAVAARCCVTPRSSGGVCAASALPTGCPAPLIQSTRDPTECEAPDERVLIAATSLVVGPSDWEAEGRVAPRTVETAAFYIDRFEATIGAVARSKSVELGRFAASIAEHDTARAAHGLTLTEASRYCAERGGRLPTVDEWVVAASGSRATRYPWGDTGAVCRRAAYGLEAGPCASHAEGPDTVGAHHDGATANGIEDMAGNVAEWVRPTDASHQLFVALGGSWRSALATELRTWSRLELASGEVHDDRVGARCVYLHDR